MNIAGIIAEYNPFHKGHLYQLLKIREELGTDTPIAVVMSGNFVQRGEPAISDKWTRCQSALSCGVDLVLELPFTFACAPSQRFARGAVAILSRLGIISHLSFGSEHIDLTLLRRISGELALSSLAAEKKMRAELREGASYAKARERALIEHFLSIRDFETAGKIPKLLTSPNTILALEYLFALEEEKSNILPLPILRKGSGYLEDDEIDGTMSATGIRRIVRNLAMNIEGSASHLPGNSAPALAGRLPAPSLARILTAWQQGISPVFPEDFASPIVRSIAVHDNEWISRIAYMQDNLSRRLKNSLDSLKLSENQTLHEAFSQKAYTKRYANTRINRALISLLLGQTQEDIEMLSSPQYIRVLGFSKKGRYLLKRMRDTACLPIITKSSDFLEYGKDRCFTRMAELDLLSSEMWNEKAGLPYGDEFNRQVIQREKSKIISQ